MQSVNDCFDKIKADCFKYFDSQKIKFTNKDKILKSFFIPICFWISKKKILKDPIIIGLSGGQGSGKTTASSIISIILKKYFKLNVCKVSIDDFYKTKKERELLSKTKHPLLITRGVPGTHDINMLIKFFEKIKNKNFKKFKFPKFNKAIDDRYKKNHWNSIKSKPQIVIFEGWCIGAKHQNYKQLKRSVNSVEKKFDKSFEWRKFVNLQLMTKYKKLFNQIDSYLYLKPDNFNLLKKWRIKQEKKLLVNNKNKKNLKIMNEKDVLIFMQTYQRITQQMFKDMPKNASIIVKLNKNHQIYKIKFN
ncbi:uridine kinase [Candidatus Pelagibacter sp.]|nr:uridine kinase [Candidatus Pelagibacter sp.]